MAGQGFFRYTEGSVAAHDGVVPSVCYMNNRTRSSTTASHGTRTSPAPTNATISTSWPPRVRCVPAVAAAARATGIRSNIMVACASSTVFQDSCALVRGVCARWQPRP